MWDPSYQDYTKHILCGIYSLKNKVDGKQYIGMSRNILRRWHEHILQLTQQTHDNRYLQFAWDKYGEENFEFSILELCNESLLSERECYYIKVYQSMSHQHGYNLTPGGENTSIGKLIISLRDMTIFNSVRDAAKHAGVVSITMITWCKNKHYYAYLEDFNNMSKTEQEYWCTYDWAKYDHERLSQAHSRENLSKESLKKYSQSVSGSNNPRAYKVYCPQLDETFDCVKHAAQKYKLCYTSILNCVNGKVSYVGHHPITNEKLTWEKV